MATAQPVSQMGHSSDRVMGVGKGEILGCSVLKERLRVVVAHGVWALSTFQRPDESSEGTAARQTGSAHRFQSLWCGVHRPSCVRPGPQQTLTGSGPRVGARRGALGPFLGALTSFSVLFKATLLFHKDCPHFTGGATKARGLGLWDAQPNSPHRGRKSTQAS